MSFKHIPHQVATKPDSYGIVTDKRGLSSIVLTNKEGQILVKTESFKQNKELQSVLQSLDRNISNELNFCFRENVRGQSYFIIRAANGYSLAISETYADRKLAESAAVTAREIAKNAKLFHFPPVARSMDE